MAEDLNVSFNSLLVDAFIQSFQEHQDNVIGILIGSMEDYNVKIDNFVSYVDDESLIKVTDNSENDALVVGYYLKGDISNETEFKILRKLDQLNHIRSKQYDLPLKLEFNVKDNKINIYNCVVKDGNIFKFNQLRSVHKGGNKIEYKNFDEDCSYFIVYNRYMKLNKSFEKASIAKQLEGPPTPFQLQRQEYLYNGAMLSQGNECIFDPSILDYSESKDYVHILENYCDKNHFQCFYNFVVNFEDDFFRGSMRFMPTGLICGGSAKSSYQAKQVSAQKLLEGLRCDVFRHLNPTGENFFEWKGPVQNKIETQNEVTSVLNENIKSKM